MPATRTKSRVVSAILVSMLSASLILSACAPASSSAANATPTATRAQVTSTPVAAKATASALAATETRPTAASTIPAASSSDGGDSALDNAAASKITLNGKTITVNGSGATVSGSRVTITAAGAYGISGDLSDGQILVDTQDAEKVTLILNGADIACSTSAPIFVVNAEKVVITLAEGTQNSVTDGKTYLYADPTSDEPSAAIFSNDDLTINGAGSLTVSANYKNGIQSKDDLKITGGNITVTAVSDGLKGKDSITIKNGAITVDAGGDGLQSTNAEEAERGYISIEGGTLAITAALDGIQAETNLLVSGGDITITSGGGSGNSSASAGNPGNTWGAWGGKGNTSTGNTTPSAKGLKAGVDLIMDGGTLNINSSDDALHANGSLTINGGVIEMTSGDDGIHADTAVTINGGEISIAKSYEGIESAVITINDGTIHVVSSDDGLNIVGGVDGSGMGGRPGQGTFNYTGSNYLYINGGYLAVNSGGDGLDVNGAIVMTGGVVLVHGPTANMNGALDHSGFKMTGGLLVAAGSSGMAMTPDTTSTQYSVSMNFSSAVTAGTIIRVQTQDGEDIVTFAPAKVFQSVVVSSPELKKGATYAVYGGGSSTGAAADGLFSGGTYSGGNQLTSFTISSVLTILGSYGGGGMRR